MICINKKQCRIDIKLILCCFLLFSLTTCSETEKETGFVLVKDWQIGSSYEGNIYPIAYGENIILTSFEDHSFNCLASYSKANGELNWKWCDSAEVASSFYYNLRPYLYNNLLALPNKNQLLVMDVEKGIPKWQTQNYDHGDNVIEGIDNKILRTYYDNNTGDGIIIEINIEEQSLRPICKVSPKNEEKVFLKTPIYTKDNLSRKILQGGVIHYNPNTHLTRNFIYSWLLQDGSEVSKLKITDDNNKGHAINKQPYLSDGFSYWFAHNDLLCYSLTQHKIVWQKEMNTYMITSRPLIQGDNIYYAGENGILYCINKFDGSLRWDQKISGSPSRVFYSNDCIILVGGQDGVLYVFDAASGNSIFKIKSDNHDIKKGVFFQRHLYVDNDVILLNDTQNWVCYKIKGSDPVNPILF
jgi:putative pyrroloquinoline-quinone binding quinoprotein